MCLDRVTSNIWSTVLLDLHRNIDAFNNSRDYFSSSMKIGNFYLTQLKGFTEELIVNIYLPIMKSNPYSCAVSKQAVSNILVLIRQGPALKATEITLCDFKKIQYSIKKRCMMCWDFKSNILRLKVHHGSRKLNWNGNISQQVIHKIILYFSLILFFQNHKLRRLKKWEMLLMFRTLSII